ncbi:MAG: hypothetical protein PHY94_08530 [Candidatus Omnitrophica bacterium]|nr:hypothetical protein [Candidatus Omnitrophota bacterium]
MNFPTAVKILLLVFLTFSLILLSGCATTWDRQRQQLNRSYKQGEISDDNYNLLIRKINKDEQVFMQQSSEDQVLRQQAKQREEEGYYIPPPQDNRLSGKKKNCSARCDYYGNCETVCE